MKYYTFNDGINAVKKLSMYDLLDGMGYSRYVLNLVIDDVEKRIAATDDELDQIDYLESLIQLYRVQNVDGNRRKKMQKELDLLKKKYKYHLNRTREIIIQ